jgi:hypothetical protein
MVLEGCPSQAQSLCNPVLGDAKTVHAKYFDVKIHVFSKLMPNNDLEKHQTLNAGYYARDLSG